MFIYVILYVKSLKMKNSVILADIVVNFYIICLFCLTLVRYI
jgi:hypothetical protein